MMHRTLLIKTLALLQLILTVSGLPLQQNQPLQPNRVFRRASYSVVAVDGGSATSTTAQSSPMKTLTLTTSETKILDHTRTLEASLTSHATKTSVTTATVTPSQSNHTVTITSTITKDSSATNTVSLLTSILTVTETTTTTTARACETLAPLPSIVNGNPAPPATPDVTATTTITQTSTVTSFLYGSPPIPTTYSNGGGARYSASQPWNNTLTFGHGPTGTAWATAQVSSSPISAIA